jgi:hypothetical protein
LTIKLEIFSYDIAEQFFTNTLLENDFWLFGSNSTAITRPLSQNTERESKEFLEKTIFGLKYQPSDFSFMVPINLWRSDTVYTQYDDTADLSESQFYVVTEPDFDAGNYHIFKCISNNNRARSTEKPEFSPSIQDGLYFLTDGYVWKYMTSTTSVLYNKFASRGLIPVFRNQSVENISNDGIYNIVVENVNENFGYERITGNVQATNISVNSGTTTVLLKNVLKLTSSGTAIFNIADSYAKRSLYIEKSNLGQGIDGFEARILKSGLINNVPFVTIETPLTEISIDDKVEILPSIEIKGNGIGAKAIPIFDNTNTRIDTIRMLDFGIGYTTAVASVIDPIGFDPDNQNRQDIKCVIRPIISPNGGHGANVLAELYSSNIGLSKTITSATSSNITSVGSYSKIGLVKNPIFEGIGNTEFTDTTFDNRIKMELEVIPDNMQSSLKVFQGEVTATIHEVDLENNLIYLVEYDGNYIEEFTESLPLLFEGANYDINSIEYSPYVSKSGTVLTVSSVIPVERSASGSERIRLILDF